MVEKVERLRSMRGIVLVGLGMALGLWEVPNELI